MVCIQRLGQMEIMPNKKLPLKVKKTILNCEKFNGYLYKGHYK